MSGPATTRSEKPVLAAGDASSMSRVSSESARITMAVRNMPGP